MLSVQLGQIGKGLRVNTREALTTPAPADLAAHSSPADGRSGPATRSRSAR